MPTAPPRTQPARARLALAAAALSILLAACGGGGDEAVPAAGSGGSGTAAADCGITGFTSQALARINALRAAGASCGAQGSFAPAAAVRWNDALAEAAAGHSRDMAAQNYFSHTSADGRTLRQRVDATGYAWSALGENIAAGQTGIDEVFEGWRRSDGHCANLMNPQFDSIGLACAPGTSGNRYRTYWTLDLARGR